MPKPHKRQDPRWRAVLALKKLEGKLGVEHFTQIRRLGRGDVGSVHLVRLKGSALTFAMKVRVRQGTAQACALRAGSGA